MAVIVPYLNNAKFFDIRTLVLAVSLIPFHYFSFGHNSLMDTAMGYDLRDPSKKHHPLVSGVISLHFAHNVIHWGLALLITWASIFTLIVSPNPAVALLCLMLWVAFGHGYNDGLSKESIFGFMSISICWVGATAWGWFLSHSSLDLLGVIYLAYTFFTILFQISWSGFIKEMALEERSNILKLMGAKIVERDGPYFEPSFAMYYGIAVKVINLSIGMVLLSMRYSVFGLVMFVVFYTIALLFMWKLVLPRPYRRGKELFNMSIEEIATIYLPIPIMMSAVEASVLMVVGVLYFFMVNFILWERPYPRV